MSSNEPLFSQDDLRALLEGDGRRMVEEIQQLDANRLLNTGVEDLAQYFEQKYAWVPLTLREAEITVEHEEVQVAPRHAQGLRPAQVTATAYRVFIPYDGDSALFRCQPSQHTYSPPLGALMNDQLVLTYVRDDHDDGALKGQIESDLGEVRRYLGWIEAQVSKHNAGLLAVARARINARREKLLKDQGLVASLGFPLRKRSDAPQTYGVPVVRRKIQPRMPAATTSPFVPEPALDMSQYDEILSIISNMVLVMERSPEAFRGMGEEDLRTQMLVPLNGPFDGEATGETFNFEGKTDILIRSKGKNIFIAECKFWDGPKSVGAALDQLLGYASWRDTKTALLVFNRNRDFTAVLDKMREAVKSYSNFKRELPYPSETGYRCVLHHRDDKNRELILTVLAFEVPA